jgi:hypothetical protein
LFRADQAGVSDHQAEERPVSPDGRWVWTGSSVWVPVSFFPVLPASSTLRPVSPDGTWVWNGRRWEHADEPVAPVAGCPELTPSAQFGPVPLVPPGAVLAVLTGLFTAIVLSLT